MIETLRNPYVFASCTAVVARLTQWISSLVLLKSDWSYHNDLFFLNLTDAHLKTTYIGTNFLIALSIMAMGYIYLAYIKEPGTQNRNGLIALATSLLLVALHIIATLILTSNGIASFNGAELGASMMRNFVIVVGSLFIAERLFSFFD